MPQNTRSRPGASRSGTLCLLLRLDTRGTDDLAPALGLGLDVPAAQRFADELEQVIADHAVAVR